MFELCCKEVKLDADVKFEELAKLTNGYNGADINAICRDAAMMGMRRKIADMKPEDIKNLKQEDMGKINCFFFHFSCALMVTFVLIFKH